MEERTLLKEKGLTRQKKRLIFYTCLIAIPSIQFAIFYVYVNINSILLAFQKYEVRLDGIGYNVSFAFFENFSEAWKIFTNSGQMVLNSLYLYLSNLVIVSTLALFFSYYIAKKHAFSGFFRVMLFMPSIISQVALVTIFRTVVDDVFVEVAKSLGLEAWLNENNIV
jgi:multiple sugar transport system permease protein/N-acetylglucosamine transport system permease protein